MSSLSGLYDGCRSYRRFKQQAVPREILTKVVDTARKRSSAMNAQPLRYVVVTSAEKVAAVQPCLRWAAKLPKDIGTPKPDEQPTAFVVVLQPETANRFADIDLGIALDTMAITAWSHGVGSCIVAAVDQKALTKIVPVPEGFAIGVVLALGYPAHKSTVVAPDDDHGLAYYVDEKRDYYVPKRALEAVATVI